MTLTASGESLSFLVGLHPRRPSLLSSAETSRAASMGLIVSPGLSHSMLETDASSAEAKDAMRSHELALKLPDIRSEMLFLR